MTAQSIGATCVIRKPIEVGFAYVVLELAIMYHLSPNRRHIFSVTATIIYWIQTSFLLIEEEA